MANPTLFNTVAYRDIGVQMNHPVNRFDRAPPLVHCLSTGLTHLEPCELITTFISYVRCENNSMNIHVGNAELTALPHDKDVQIVTLANCAVC
jgi:hypothetical protein